MRAKAETTEATTEDLYQVPDKAEIVNGDRTYAANRDLPSEAGLRMSHNLVNYKIL